MHVTHHPRVFAIDSIAARRDSLSSRHLPRAPQSGRKTCQNVCVRINIITRVCVSHANDHAREHALGHHATARPTNPSAKRLPAFRVILIRRSIAIHGAYAKGDDAYNDDEW